MSRCKANPCCMDPHCCVIPLPQHSTGLIHLNKEVVTTEDPAVTTDNFDHAIKEQKINTWFKDFDEALAERQQAWVADGDGDKLPVEFYAIELVGEIGELFNVIKKLMREAYGVRGSRATQQDKEEEFGDVLICLKNMAAKYGVDLEAVARRKFNATSEKYGFPHRVREK